MKLYLSSYRIPDSKVFSEFIGKDITEVSIGLILNAQDYKSDKERNEKREELFVYFKDLGCSIEEIDLRDYNKEQELKNKMSNHDAVWFNGGNTFCLRWAIEQSACGKELLVDVLQSGTVYAGDSAGAITTGPTLKHFDAADNPDAVPEVIYEGFNFVDFVVLPHWESEKYGDIIKSIGDKLKQEGYNTKSLTDDEFIFVENGEVAQNL